MRFFFAVDHTVSFLLFDFIDLVSSLQLILHQELSKQLFHLSNLLSIAQWFTTNVI